MRRGVLLALCLGLGLTACGGGSTGDTELHVFAAASLQEALTEIGTRYEADHPGVALVFHFDSSGALKTQIQEGAECDVFLSAGKRQMDQLDAAAAPAVDAAAPEEEPAGVAPDLIDSNTRRTPAGLQASAGGRSGWNRGTCWRRWETAMCRWGSTLKGSSGITVWMRRPWPPPASSPTGPTSRR